MTNFLNLLFVCLIQLCCKSDDLANYHDQFVE